MLGERKKEKKLRERRKREMQTRTVSTTLSSYVKHKTYTCRNIKGIISAVKDYETVEWQRKERKSELQREKFVC